jgi:hypothetical protein
MKPIALVITALIIGVLFMATIAKTKPQKVECEVVGQSPAIVRKDYLNLCMR